MPKRLHPKVVDNVLAIYQQRGMELSILKIAQFIGISKESVRRIVLGLRHVAQEGPQAVSKYRCGECGIKTIYAPCPACAAQASYDRVHRL